MDPRKREPYNWVYQLLFMYIITVSEKGHTNGLKLSKEDKIQKDYSLTYNTTLLSHIFLY